MIKVNNLSFGHTEKPLYSEVNFIVGKGQKVGLVGANGSGKTTLLKLISGIMDTNTGSVEVKGSIGWVPQEIKHDPFMEASSTVSDYVNPEHTHPEHEVLRMFAGLELDLSLNSKPQKLSGGQKTKLALARALLSEPDILLLDEPTNFMDIEGKRWVMDFLAEYPNTVILISHDLELMNHAIDKVLYVNSVSKKIDEYKGNYSQFIKLKAEREELLKRQIVVQEKHIKRMEAGLKNMARFTSEKGVRRRVQQERRIEKLKATLPDLPQDVKKIKVKLPEPSHVGELPLRAIDICKSFGERVILNNICLSVKRGERIALIGPNGAGKSTLLKIIVGILSPDAGEVIKTEALKIGYYSQEFETFDLNKKVIEMFMENTKRDEQFSRAFLGRYMLSGDKVFQKVETLSGGEKTRLSIAMLTAHDYNLLVLDEPTTYLDVMSQRVILEALKEYKGSMLIVSHTPEFVKELTPSRAVLFPEGRVVYWDEYLVDKVIET